MQLILSSNPPDHVALSNPWTEYVKFLDDHVPVPTLWSEDQRLLLQGTSLEVTSFDYSYPSTCPVVCFLPLNHPC